MTIHHFRAAESQGNKYPRVSCQPDQGKACEWQSCMKLAGIPDMRYINRETAILDVALALDIRKGQSGMLHCWHPDRHQHGDRTASVGLRKSTNTVKCFGCGCGPFGPIDLAMDVHEISAADAALWIAERFPVPVIRARKRLCEQLRPAARAGHEHGLELLIRSGLWARLNPAAHAIAAVLLSLNEKWAPYDEPGEIRISYVSISRYSGIVSHNAIRRALVALIEIGFIGHQESATASRGPDRETACYKLTPNSDLLWELAQSTQKQMQQEIAVEMELRRRKRTEKRQSLTRE